MPDYGTISLGVWYRTLCLLVLLGAAGAASAQVAPVANNDAISVTEGGTATQLTSGQASVLANDFDNEASDGMVAVLVSAPANSSSFNLNADGTFSYVHDGSNTTADSFTYQAQDAGGTSNIATVLIGITRLDDDPPTANGDAINVAEGGTATQLTSGQASVLANDIDNEPPTGDLQASLVSGPANAASFTLNPNGTFSYTHDGSNTTADSFTYRAQDAGGSSNVATVVIGITRLDDDPPTANGDAINVAEGGTATQLTSGQASVLANDVDNEPPTGDLQASLVSGPANAASFTLNPNGTFSYTHDGSNTTADSFTYRAQDAGGSSNIATVAITITPVPDAPVANNDAINVAEGGTATQLTSGQASVLANDVDNEPPAGDLQANLVSGPANAASFTLNPNGTFSYTHDDSNTTTDSFTYQAQDAGGTSNTATVSIAITAVNDPPTAVDDSAEIDEDNFVDIDVLANDTDPDNPPSDPNAGLSVESFTQPGNGRVDNRPDGTLRYTPDKDFSGTDTFTYVVTDGELTDDATVTVLVNSLNDPPVITGQTPDPLVTAEETAITIGVDNLIITDADGDTDFTLTVLPGPNYSVAGATVTPAVNFNGVLSVAVTASDGSDDSDPFPLQVQVTPVNDAPVITGQTPSPLVTAEDSSLTVTFANLTVSDPDNAYPAGFTLTLVDGDDYDVVANVLTPAPDFNGSLTVPAVVNDGQADSQPFNLAVTVTPVNDAPVLIAPIPDQQAVERSLFSFDTSAYFGDTDAGDTLTFAAAGLPASGNLSIDVGTGVISGTPELTDAADVPYTVVVTARDASGETAAGEFSLTVAGLDRANVALEVAATPAPALVGEQVSWTFSVSNSGPAPAVAVRLQAEISGDALDFSVQGIQGCSLQAVPGQPLQLTCDIGDLATGASMDVVVPGTAVAAGDVTVAGAAAVTGPLPLDPNELNNLDTQDLSVAQAFSNGPTQSIGTVAGTDAGLGDVNGDGAPDLVVATPAGASTEIFLSDGNRSLLTPALRLGDASASEGVALADVDADGDQDLILANTGQASAVYLNDGAGNLSLAASLAAGNARDVVTVDLDGDGDADLAFAAGSPNPVFSGDGAGGFTAADQLGDADSRGVASGDFDGDGRADLVFANSDGPSRVYRNTGNTANRFTASVGLGTGGHQAVTVADFDGDGVPDIAFAAAGADGSGVPNPVYLNDGAGGFALAASLGAAVSLDIASLDVDQDGDIDVLCVNDTGAHQVYLNDGSATFVLDAEQLLGIGALAAAIGDIDTSGYPDVVLTGADPDGSSVFLNDNFGELGLGDAIAPVITLLGEQQITIVVGQAYNDPGATAEDNVDGNISDQIVVDNPVNSDLVGTFTVTYTVTDAAGNPATPATRTVRVDPRPGTSSGGGGGGAALWLLFVLPGLAAIVGVLRHGRKRADSGGVR